MTSEEQIAFIAGFFDGEGCISVQKNGGISVGIVNTSKNVLEFIQSICGGSIQERSQIVNKKQYVYRIYGEDAIIFIDSIKKYLIDKKEQAETVIEYFNLREEIKPIRIPGRRGAFANPKRDYIVSIYRDLLSDQKLEEH